MLDTIAPAQVAPDATGLLHRGFVKKVERTRDRLAAFAPLPVGYREKLLAVGGPGPIGKKYGLALVLALAGLPVGQAVFRGLLPHSPRSACRTGAKRGVH